MSTSYVMKVSRNGQVSIPADARARWNADRVVVVDLGDRIVMRPLSEDAAGYLVGKYRHGPSTALYAIGHCLALLPVALMPTVFGFAGAIYFVVALGLGLVFLWSAVGLARRGTLDAARRLMVTSLVYLPVLLGVLALDRVPLP